MFKKIKNLIWYYTSCLLMLLYPIKTYADDRNFAGFEVGDGGELTFKPPSNSTEALGVDNLASDVASEGNRMVTILKIIVQGAEGIVAIILVGLFCYKAFLLMTCSDDSPLIKHKRAWEMVMCLVGIAVTGGAWFITTLLFTAFAG